VEQAGGGVLDARGEEREGGDLADGRLARERLAQADEVDDGAGARGEGGGGGGACGPDVDEAGADGGVAVEEGAEDAALLLLARAVLDGADVREGLLAPPVARLLHRYHCPPAVPDLLVKVRLDRALEEEDRKDDAAQGAVGMNHEGASQEEREEVPDKGG
jgi:hypothetical protein